MPKRIHRRRDADPAEGLEKYIHQPRNSAKYTAAETRTIKSYIRTS